MKKTIFWLEKDKHLHKPQRKRLRIRNKLISVAIEQPGIFFVAFVNNLLGAHGLYYGQNVIECFLFLLAKHADAENANYAIKVSYLYSLVNSSGLGIKMADGNRVKSKSLSQKVKQVKPYVYLIECSSH